MASLTHVCFWNGEEKCWKRITAEQAVKKNPKGTVHAHSGLFMCELCGQHVLLTAGEKYTRHFRHSSREKDKDCPERRFGPGVRTTYEAEEHELPIKIIIDGPSSFSLQLGLIQIPDNLINSSLRVEIKSDNKRNNSLVYSNERLSSAGISYVFLDEEPSKNYYLKVLDGSKDIYHFWPEKISGITPEGTIFDIKTGKKLPYDANVISGEEYLLLKRGIVSRYNEHISIQKVCSRQIAWRTWNVYKVKALDYDESVASFFLDYHCRLSEHILELQPVWPVYVETPYLIKHDRVSTLMHIKGNDDGYAQIHAFPNARMLSFGQKSNKIIEVFCNNRQQLISVGRTKALRYTYFWKEPLDHISGKPVVKVFNINGEPVTQGRVNKSPQHDLLRVLSPYDGFIIKKRNDEIIDKQKIKAGVISNVSELTWDTQVLVYVGMDLVWECYFSTVKEQKKNEKQIIRRLKSMGEPYITLPHSAGSMVSMLREYPLIRIWLHQRLKEGKVSSKAFKELKHFINTEIRR